MKVRIPLLLLTSVAIIGLSHRPAQAQRAMRMGGGVERAVCVIEPVGGSGVSGTIFFTHNAGRLHVAGKISGLKPGKHGFHVHEFGDLTSMKDGLSTGGHFDPEHNPHGAPDAMKRHVGDLGNIEANADGVATVDVYDTVIQLNGPHSILGRGLVVHANPDKYTQPTGDAGGRVGVGVIGIANPKSK